jgi:hypothetical protein
MYSSERRPAGSSQPASAASTPQRSGATPSSAAARAASSLLQRLARDDAAQQAQAADEVAALCAAASAIGGGGDECALPLLDLLNCQGIEYALLRAAGDLVRSADADGAVPAARASYGALAALLSACAGARLDIERNDAEALIAALRLPDDGASAAAAIAVAALQRVRGNCGSEAECSASVPGFCDAALSDALAGALLHVVQTQPVDGAGPLTCLGVLCDWLVGLTRDGEGAASPALAAAVRHAVMRALRTSAPAALVAGARLLQAASMQAEVNVDEPLTAELHALLREDSLLDALLGILEARSPQPNEVQYAVLEAMHLLLQPASDATAQDSAAALPRLAAYLQRRPPPPCFAAASAIASATSYFRGNAARADAFCQAGGLAALVQLLEHAIAARDGYEDAQVPMGACVSGEEEEETPYLWHHQMVVEAARALQQLAKEAVPGMEAAMLQSGAAAALSDVLQRAAGRAAAFDDGESIDGICTRFEVSQLSAGALALLHLCDQGGSEMRAAFRDAGGLDALCSALHRRTQPHETWDVLSALAAAVRHEPLSQTVVCELKNMRVLVRLIAAPDATVAVFRLLQVLFDGGAASRAAFCECAGATAVSQELLQFQERTAVPAVALLRALCADPGGCNLLYDAGAVPALLGAVFDGGVARDAALEALAALVSGSPKAAEEVLSTELQPVMEVLMVCLNSINSQGASLKEGDDDQDECCSSSSVRTPSGGGVSSADETVNRDTPVATDGHADASDEVEELRAQIAAMTTQMATLRQMQSAAQSTASPAPGGSTTPPPAQLSWAYAGAIAATAFAAALVVAPLLHRATRLRRR